jgi:hypothetical protein
VTGAGGRGDVPAKILTNAVMLPLLQASCGNCRRGTTYLQWSSRSTTGIPTGWLQRWHAMCTRQWEGRRLCPAELEASPAASESQQLPWPHRKPGAQGVNAECTLLKVLCRHMYVPAISQSGCLIRAGYAMHKSQPQGKGRHAQPRCNISGCEWICIAELGSWHHCSVM